MRGGANLPETRGMRTYQAATSRRIQMGNDRRTVELRKFLNGHWGEGIGFPMYLALYQSSNAGRTNQWGLNGAEFGHWPVVPADDDHVTLFDSVNVAREVGLGLLNVDSYHAVVPV